MHLSIFILVINQIDAQNLIYNKFISRLYMFRAPCAHRQEVKIVLYSLWYHHTYRWPSRAQVERGPQDCIKSVYEGESNENRKYFYVVIY